MDVDKHIKFKCICTNLEESTQIWYKKQYVLSISINNQGQIRKQQKMCNKDKMQYIVAGLM